MSADAAPAAAPTVSPARISARRRAYPIAVAAVFVVALLLRARAVFTEPTLDEIWSVRLAEHATSAVRIVTAPDYHVDNNHWLNTIYCYALGERGPFYPYRLLALASGAVLLAAVWAVARAWGRAAALVALTLTAVSFVCVNYAAEARGYGPAAACTVVAQWTLRRALRTAGGRGGTIAAAVGFAAACVFGFLAHVCFAYAFFGAIAYATLVLARRPGPWVRRAGTFAAVFAVPTLFAAWLYVTAVQPMRVAGGTRPAADAVLADAFAFTAGAPANVVNGWAALAATAAVAGYGAVVLARRGRDEWAFLLTAGLLAPAVILTVQRPDLLAMRYLFVAVPFLLLLTATALADLMRRGPAAAVVAGLTLVAFVVGNGDHLRRFYADGHGQTGPMLRYLVTQTPGPTVTLAAAQKFRMTMVVNYFRDRVDTAAKAFQYVPPRATPQPEWFLVDGGGFDPVPPRLAFPDWPIGYRIAAVFPAYGVSGVRWSVYRRDEGRPPALLK